MGRLSTYLIHDRDCTLEAQKDSGTYPLRLVIYLDIPQNSVLQATF